MTYAVDFDGTIVTNAYPYIGKPITKTINFIKQKQRQGHKIILWTCRTGEELEEAVEFCKKHLHIIFDAINANINEPITTKIFADVYIDDRALNVEDL